MPVMKLISFGILLFLRVDGLRAENYYVDAARGKDDNPGNSPGQAWRSVTRVNQVFFRAGDVIHFHTDQVWRESLVCRGGEGNSPVTYTSYGEGRKPLFLASIDVCHLHFWTARGNNIWCVLPEYFSTGNKPLQQNIGNIILVQKGETEKKAAWKRWNIEDLKAQGDFYHDTTNDLLYFYSPENPASMYSVMEAAMKRDIIVIRKCSYLVVDGLAAAYTGAHGINGVESSHCIIRNCDFSWIGGSYLYTRNGKPVRYGNGIQFWNSAADNLVENNYFEQIYDVAMTNQGPEACLVKNIIWRKNKIYRCEQAHEIWLSDPDARMQNVVFDGNECIDSGFGWSHEQRPDKTGAHILAYLMEAGEFDIHYMNNVFHNAVNAMIWYVNPRLPEAHMDHNIYIQKADDCTELPLFRWGNNHVSWDEYRSMTGHDKHSVFVCE
jgi:hypothetical protein